MIDPAQRLLEQLDEIVAPHPGLVAAHGAAVIEGEEVVALAGFCGMTLAAPGAILQLLNSAPPAALVLTNDPYAGGVGLDHLFLVGRSAGRAVIAALAFRDFGAMRKDVFRRRAETFHEGLALSVLPVDWDGPERDVVLGVIAANVRDGEAARAITDRVARATLAACASPGGIRPGRRARTAVPVTGRAEGRAAVANSNGASIETTLDAAGGEWRLALILDSENAGALARCSAAAIRSASVLGVADALGLPRTAPLQSLVVTHANLAAVAPDAVGEGTPVAYGCYRAAFDAARKLRTGGAATPRDEAAFLARD
jgi:hypothetical protein